GWVLDIAGFAVHAVLRIDLQAVLAVVILDEIIDPGRAVACFGAAKFGQVYIHWNGFILEREMDGLIFLMVRVRDKNGTKAVEGQFSIGLGILDAGAFRSRLQTGVVR